jgi:photosystem II stability/assembly factor-like uncharacterized protein
MKLRTGLMLLLVGLHTTVSWAKGNDEKEKNTYSSKHVSGLTFRAIGPALTSGRISDLVVNPENTSEWYIAAASGGVWKTTNSGVTFSPVFDNEGSYSIGCITLDPNNPHTVWVGTGENNNQRSVAYGDGVYVSRDGGKSWSNTGLKDSEHIGMIKVHPNNSNVVYVAAYGPLWSAGGERGLYRTVDGGKNWELILEVDEHTGINEIHLDPRNPEIMYATAHQRRRHVYTYISGGPGSAIYKTTDGGKNWRKLTSGLPSVNMGRVGMAISPANPDVLYAIIEAEDKKGGFFKSADRGESWNKVNDYVTSGNYYQELFCDPNDVDKVFAMDTYCHVTVNGGKSFSKLPEKNKHVDNHCMWINPKNTNHYLMGCDGGLYQTFDDGENWSYFPNLPITQFYRVEVDNAKPFYNVYGGTQDNFSLGGPSQTNKNSGIDNYDWFVTNEGDGFESQIDPVDPNIVYAQAQYGWLVRYDKKTGETVGIKPTPPAGEAYRWNWDAPLIISPHNHKTLYFAANKVFKSEDRGNSWKVISEDLSQQIDRNTLPVMGQVWSMDAVMKNKSTTIFGNIVSLQESPLKAGVLYAGTDDGLIHVSMNDGDSWKKIASFPGVPDMTYVNDIKPSMHDERVVYAAFNNHKNGDFKPYLLKSTDNGNSWTSIAANLPERGSIYTIAEDHENPNLLFVGTEFGVFFTVDGGKEWTALKSGLPTIAIRDIDIQKDEDDLVLASFGRGFYVLDDYSPLRQLSEEIIEKEAHIYTVKDALIYAENSKYGYGGIGFQGATFWHAKNPEIGATFTYYLKEAPKTRKQERQAKEKELYKNEEAIPYTSKAEMRAEDEEEKPYLLFSIADAGGNEVRRITASASAGMKRLVWDGRTTSYGNISTKNEPLTKSSAAYWALPGDYFVSMFQSVDGELTALVENVPFTLNALNNNTIQVTNSEKQAFQKELEALRKKASGATRYANLLKEQIKEAKAAVRNTPNVSVEHLNTLRKLEKELQNQFIVLNGNSSLSNREFETEPGINTRVGTAVWNNFYNMQPTTGIQRMDAEIAKKQLQPVLTELKRIKGELETIQKDLTDAGVPTLKGHFPNLD